MADIIVLGAGIVGVSSALALQARGHDVVLVDRQAPGEGASHGNAGAIQAEAAEPYALPRDLATLWRYAFGQSNDVLWHLRDLPPMLPTLWSYFRASAPRSHLRLSRVYAQLTARSCTDHQVLILASGSDALIRRSGLGEIYRSAAGFEQAMQGAERLRALYGVASFGIGGAESQQFEPALKAPVAGILHWTDSWSCSDPGGLTKAYARLFEARGGELQRGDARSLKARVNGWQIRTEAGPLGAAYVVIALGAASPGMVAPLGYRIKMLRKRGYHRHFAMRQALLRPYFDAANGVVATTTTRGLRVTSGAELTRSAAAPDLRQLVRGQAALGELFEIGAALPDADWHGERPCLPEMLPLIGAAPRHAGLWFNFGHGHQGFTLGPTTGLLLADLVSGSDDSGMRRLAPPLRPGRDIHRDLGA